MAVFLNEILVHIFDFLDATSLTKVSSVCKQWLTVSKTPRLWRKHVLQRWPSQHFLYQNIPVTSTNWLQVYQDLYFRGKFSPDDQKYFISCRIGEDELEVDELRSAMLAHMAHIVLKWTLVEPFEADDNGSFPLFNCNFDFYYDTHDFKWKFIDKRQEYIEDLMGYKLESKLQRKSRFIRPYQVLPSCLLLYRWLALFRSIGADESGLTFYRIWRYHLKHRDTGLLFEVCDWKAAMSCTFLKGKPSPGPYVDDCLELMDLLSHPHFIMHPLGLPGSVFRQASLLSLPSGLSRQPSASSLISNTQRSLADSTGTLDSQVNWLWTLSGTDSDDESELFYDDSGYFTNCEFFISVSHWDIEEQHTIQSSVAESWSFAKLPTKPQLYLSFDAQDENWYFYSYGPDEDMKGPGGDLLPLTNSLSRHILDNSSFHGLTTKPIPSCLALYRLICLFDMVNQNYVNLEEMTIWSVTLTHNATGAFICLRDMNGWFEISVCLTDELMNELKASQHSRIPSQEIFDHTQSLDNILAPFEVQQPEWNNEYDGDDDGDDDDGSHHGNQRDDSHDEIGSLGSSLEDQEELDLGVPPEIRNNMINLYHNDDDDDVENQVEALHPFEMIEDAGIGNHGNLESFKSDVVTLLNLLISEKFGHPYGTIAGCVA